LGKLGRRSFAWHVAGFGATLALGCRMMPRQTAPGPTVHSLRMNSSPREIQLLEHGFRFRFGAAAVGGAEAVAFDDTGWSEVSLPHTWNAADGTSKDFARGPGVYRLRFRAANAARGRCVYLRFSGVSIVSTVWLNGSLLGTHESAHSAFCFDATRALRTDGENVLVVRADNTHREDIPPREGDFTMFGGVYRDVALIVTSPVAIDPMDHASSGVYLTTPEVSRERARVRARVKVRNAGAERSVDVAVTVSDASGTVVARATTKHRATPGQSEAVVETSLEKPRLWHGRRDPHLYAAVVELSDGETLVDRVHEPLGIRSCAVDPERGFLLNGEPYELRGVNLHQDRSGKGWAISRADREEDFRLIAEMGATFVRLVHYQHDRHAHELADRIGLVVWAEHGLVNTVSENPEFSERAAKQLTELIRQNYNHPSIVAWGIGNEVQTHKPAAAKPLLERLARLVKTEDPSRSSALATCFDEPAGAYGTDLIAHNRYFGWYHGTFEEFGPWLDAQRAKNPRLPMGMAEYGAGAGPSLHSTTPKALDHSEEYQCLFHEAYWRALRARPWLWEKSVWQMFDAASAGRKEGERPGVNDKGLVSHDRVVKKDAFYWYKANWTDEPLVYVTSRRFSPRTEARTTVKVYSNCASVELRVNGRDVGRVKVDDHVALFLGVTLVPGENQIVATGRGGTIAVSDTVTWVLAGGA
jgi:beta-galactosidase